MTLFRDEQQVAKRRARLFHARRPKHTAARTPPTPSRMQVINNVKPATISWSKSEPDENQADQRDSRACLLGMLAAAGSSVTGDS